MCDFARGDAIILTAHAQKINGSLGRQGQRGHRINGRLGTIRKVKAKAVVSKESNELSKQGREFSKGRFVDSELHIIHKGCNQGVWVCLAERSQDVRHGERKQEDGQGIALMNTLVKQGNENIARFGASKSDHRVF